MNEAQKSLEIGKIKDNLLLDLRGIVTSPNFVSVSLKLAILFLIPLVAYFQDFVQVFNLALSDSEAQYVLLVPFVAGYFFYRRWRVFSVSRKNSRALDLTGISLCLLALLIYVLGSYSFYTLELHLASLPVFLVGMILLLFGADVLRLLIFPTSLLIFLSPFPLFFMDAWGGTLMNSDGAIAAGILRPFLPIDITYQPVVILTTITAAGAKIQFSLNAACSGIYSLTAFLFCAVVFGYLASGSFYKKVIYGALGVVVAYFLNVFRITATVVLGHFFGLGLAVDFFHAVSGTVLAFIGTLLLLYFGSKVLKLSFVPKKDVCSFCKDAQKQASQLICLKCGRILRWKKIKLNWKRLAFLFLFLLVCADLIAQASAINYNVTLNGEQNALNFNPTTGELAALANSTGWYPTFLGREKQAESTLSLVFVGDYMLSKNDGSGTISAIFEVSDLQSKFHTWEGCLNYQSYPINIKKINYITIYDNGSNIVNGETIVAVAPTLNQTLNIVYWFDSLNLKTNGTVTTYAVKLTLLKYTSTSNDPAIQSSQVNSAISQLVSLARSYEDVWSQYKTSNYSFAIDLYRNKEAFEGVVIAMLFLSACALILPRFLKPAGSPAGFAALPMPQKSLALPEFIPAKPTIKPPDVATIKISQAKQAPPEAKPAKAAVEVPPLVPFVVVSAVSGTKFAFVGAPSSVEAGVTSGPISVQLQNDKGSPVSADVSIVVSLSPKDKWYLDSQGTLPIVKNQITIDSGSSDSPVFYFKSNEPNTVDSTVPTFNLGEGNRASFQAKKPTIRPFTIVASSGYYEPAVASLMVTPKSQSPPAPPPQQLPTRVFVPPVILSTPPPPKEKILDHIVISQGSRTITAGGSQVYTVESFDESGDSMGNVAALFTAPGALLTGNMVTATAAGDYVVTAEYQGKTAEATLTVIHAVASSVLITPSNSSVTAGETQTFTALASDLYGNTWDVTSDMAWRIHPQAKGSWDGNVYTSAKAGFWVVTGTYNKVPYTAHLFVNTAELDHFEFSDMTTQTVNSAFNLAISGVDAYGNTVKNYAGIPTLTASVGSINPNAIEEFSSGVWRGSVTLTAPGAEVTITAVDGGNSGTSKPFTVNPIIDASVGPNGSISPSGVTAVGFGSSQTYTVTPAPSSRVVDVLVDGQSVGAVLSYTFSNIVESHRIVALFAAATHAISVSAGANGEISPSGPVNVNHLGSQVFTVTPNEGYRIADVLVNGVSILSSVVDGKFSLSDVDADASVQAVFELNVCNVTVNVGPHGSSNLVSQKVNYKSNLNFIFKPDVGYHIGKILIDDVPVDVQISLNLNIIKDTAINVTFEVDTFSIAITQTANCQINGPTSVNFGEEATFTIVPSVGYHLVNVILDGIPRGIATKISIRHVQAAHSITATVAVDTFVISASAGDNGTISPSGSIQANYGSDQTYIFTPEAHYHVADVLADGVSVGAVSSYTFSNVTAPHTLSVSFEIDVFTLFASAGVGGVITPSGQVDVKYDESFSFQIMPNAHYHITDVSVDGSSVGAVTSYKFDNVSASHTINVTFAIETFNIVASAGAGGKISPNGIVRVDYGATQSFNITADSGFQIVALIVDSVSQGEVSPHTANMQAEFKDVTAPHMLIVIFAADTCAISASAGFGGTISPSGSVNVNYGVDQLFTLTANPGYRVADVLVDGASQGGIPPDATTIQVGFKKVVVPHTIVAIFAPSV